MEEIFNNLSSLEKQITDFVEGANIVRMGDILNFLSIKNTEYIQNTVRDLVNKEVLVMNQNPITPDWTYELSYFYKHYKNSL